MTSNAASVKPLSQPPAREPTNTPMGPSVEAAIDGSAIFAEASEMSRRALAAAGTLEWVKKNRSLLTQGASADLVWVVVQGRVRLTRNLPNGNFQVLGYRGAGDVLGPVVAVDEPFHRESAVAAESVCAVRLPAAVVRAVAEADTAIRRACMAELRARVAEAEDRLAAILFQHVEARLCGFLLKAAERWGIPDPRGTLISASFTHQELAAMIGSTRETVTLTLGDLRRAGVIEIDRRKIVLLDDAALKQRAE